MLMQCVVIYDKAVVLVLNTSGNDLQQSEDDSRYIKSLGFALLFYNVMGGGLSG